MWFLIVALTFLFVALYFVLMYLYPEWVGISGEDTQRDLEAHKETQPKETLPEKDLMPKDESSQ